MTRQEPLSYVLHVRVPAQDAEKLVQVAQADGRSVAGLVRVMVRKVVSEAETTRL